MTVRELKDAIRHVPPLQLGDSAAKAVRLMRARGVPTVPVARGGAVVGMVREGDVFELMTRSPDARRGIHALPVAQVMSSAALVAVEHQPLADLARGMQAERADAVPVVDAGNRYLGILLARDILAALAGQPIVPPVAGLATPAGVYLTTGSLRAGAGDLGLIATGAALMAFDLISGGVVLGASWLADRLFPLSEGTLGADEIGATGVIAAAVFWGLHMLLFLALLRASPLTGTHGAEHMVVHAIEEGEDLELEKVRQMPRVHPRCGTNLLALLILLVIAQQSLASLGRMGESTRMVVLFLLVMIVLLTWRRLGAALQRWITTKRPSDRQLLAAIKVAEDLLAKVRARPGARVSTPLRVWHSGFPQVLLGFFAVAAAAEYVPALLRQLWRILQH
jgi:CBS domain-containing protein